MKNETADLLREEKMQQL